jgi:hypothetical protein
MIAPLCRALIGIQKNIRLVLRLQDVTGSESEIDASG